MISISVSGNIITTEAFGFLDGYSDGEGTDFIGSGEITPTQARGLNLVQKFSQF